MKNSTEVINFGSIFCISKRQPDNFILFYYGSGKVVIGIKPKRILCVHATKQLVIRNRDQKKTILNYHDKRDAFISCNSKKNL